MAQSGCEKPVYTHLVTLWVTVSEQLCNRQTIQSLVQLLHRNNFQRAQNKQMNKQTNTGGGNCQHYYCFSTSPSSQSRNPINSHPNSSSVSIFQSTLITLCLELGFLRDEFRSQRLDSCSPEYFPLLPEHMASLCFLVSLLGKTGM